MCKALTESPAASLGSKLCGLDYASQPRCRQEAPGVATHSDENEKATLLLPARCLEWQADIFCREPSLSCACRSKHPWLCFPDKGNVLNPYQSRNSRQTCTCSFVIPQGLLPCREAFRIHEQRSNNNSNKHRSRAEHCQAIIALATEQTVLRSARAALIPKCSGGNSWKPQQAGDILAGCVHFKRRECFIL